MAKAAVASSNGNARRARPLLDPRSPTFSREFRKAAKAFTKRATASPEAALALLVKEGILTKSGKLSRSYGG
jgi:predicted deacylase